MRKDADLEETMIYYYGRGDVPRWSHTYTGMGGPGILNALLDARGPLAVLAGVAFVLVVLPFNLIAGLVDEYWERREARP